MSTWRRWRAAAVVAVLAAGGLVGTAGPSTASPGTQAIPAGIYWIKNDASGPGNCLQMDSRGFPFVPGPLVGMTPCNASNAFQTWYITPVIPSPVPGLDFYFVINSANGSCLDADNRGGRPTYVVHVIPCSGGSTNYNQQWFLPTGPSGTIWPLAFLGGLGLDNSRDSSGGFGERVNYWPLSSTYNPNQTFAIHRHPSVL